MKKLTVLALALALLLTASQAVAQETRQVYTLDSVTVTMGDDADATDRLQAYVDYLSAGEVSTRPVVGAGNYLTGLDAAAYRALRPLLEQVADGTLASTEIKIPYEDLGVPSIITAEMLGLDYVVDAEGNTNPDLSDAVRSMMYPNLRTLLDALLADYPYTLYWYKKTAGTLMRMTDGYFIWDDYIELVPGNALYLGMYVADAYASDTFVVNKSKTTAAKTAVTNAMAVVEQYKSSSDIAKLEGYKNYICNAVSYNSAAANNSSTPYGDPWQMIYVFDGNSSTNVVCEGYAKAFQYLCDHTEFDGDITCYSVTGWMDGGGHMWNLVEMPNDKVYMADVTNSDSGTIGSGGGLFMVGYTSVADNGYVFRAGSKNINYIYDEHALATFPARLLTVSAKAWANDTQTAVDPGFSPSDWMFTTDGFAVTITGYIGRGGSVVIPRAINNLPVTTIAARAFEGSAATSALVREGVTTIQDGAFANCASLTAITVESGNEHYTAIDGALYDITGTELIAVPGGATSFTVPAAVTNVWPYAFDGCGKLTGIRVAQDTTSFAYVGGLLFSYDGRTVIRCPQGWQGMLEMPGGEHVTGIDSRAFAGCDGITWILMPSSIASIAGDAFDGIENSVVLVSSHGDFVQEYAFEHDINWRPEDDLFTNPEFTLSDDLSTVTAIRYSMIDPEQYETETQPLTLSRVALMPTCTESGQVEYMAQFDNLYFGTFNHTEPVPALGHEWGQPQYVWATDGSSVTGCLVCQRDTSHRMEEAVTATTATVLQVPTCEEDGETLYTATFEDPLFSEQGWIVRTDALGHDWTDVECVWSDDMSACTGTVHCRRDSSHDLTETAGVVYTAAWPTFEQDGYTQWRADFTQDELGEQYIIKTVPMLDPATTLVLAEGIQTIEAEAFAGTSFQAVLLPASLTSIESGAFAGCKDLRFVGFPNGDLNAIAADAFDADTSCLFAANERTYAQEWVNGASHELMLIPAMTN